jgi:hypothetical protein
MGRASISFAIIIFGHIYHVLRKVKDVSVYFGDSSIGILLLLLLLVGRYWVPRYLFKSLCIYQSLVLRPLWPIVQTPMIDEMIFGAIGGMKIGRGNRSTRMKPTPAPLCPPQNTTWQTRSRTPDRSGGKPATNRLSYGATFFSPISSPLTTRRVTVKVFDPACTRVSRYSDRLRIRRPGFDSRQGKTFFHNIQTDSGAHPAPNPMGTGGSFLGDKMAGAWNWQLASIRVPRSRILEIYFLWLYSLFQFLQPIHSQ